MHTYYVLLYCTICSHSIHGATIVSWLMQVLIEEMHFLDCCTEVSKLGKHGQRYQIYLNSQLSRQNAEAQLVGHFTNLEHNTVLELYCVEII